jgi:hypothetical protein
MQEQLRVLISEVVEEVLIETLTEGRSVQDTCEIMIEVMLCRDYRLPRDLAEDIAANVCRKLLPYLKTEGVEV